MQLTTIENENEVLSDKLSYVDKWLCYVNAELDLIQDIITPDEFALLIENCKFSIISSEIKSALSDTEGDMDTEQEDFADITETKESSGLDQKIPLSLFSVSPNPNTGSFTVNIIANYGDSEIKIYNLLGQTVKTREITNTGEQSFTIEGFTPGHYTMIFIENGKIIATEKLIVE